MNKNKNIYLLIANLLAKRKRREYKTLKGTCVVVLKLNFCYSLSIIAGAGANPFLLAPAPAKIIGSDWLRLRNTAAGTDRYLPLMKIHKMQPKFLDRRAGDDTLF